LPIGGANVERKIGKASVRDAIIGTGVAIDKMLALTGHSERYSEHLQCSQMFVHVFLRGV